MSTVRAALAAWLLLAAGAALAQTDQARPARGPASETAVPSAAPPATTSQTTGSTGQGPVVKSMNEAEKGKVEETGK